MRLCAKWMNYCYVGYALDEINIFESLKWTWDGYVPNGKNIVLNRLCVRQSDVKCIGNLKGLCDQ